MCQYVSIFRSDGQYLFPCDSHYGSIFSASSGQYVSIFRLRRSVCQYLSPPWRSVCQYLLRCGGQYVSIFSAVAVSMSVSSPLWRSVCQYFFRRGGQYVSIFLRCGGQYVCVCFRITGTGRSFITVSHTDVTSVEAGQDLRTYYVRPY